MLVIYYNETSETKKQEMTKKITYLGNKLKRYIS